MIGEEERELLRSMLRGMGLTEEEVEHELIGSVFVTEAVRYSDDVTDLLQAMYQRLAVIIGASDRLSKLLLEVAKADPDISRRLKRDELFMRSVSVLTGLAEEFPTLTTAMKEVLIDKASLDESFGHMKERYGGVETDVAIKEPTDDEKLIAEVLARHTGGGIKC